MNGKYHQLNIGLKKKMKNNTPYKKHNSFTSLKGKNIINVKDVTSKIIRLYKNSDLKIFDTNQKNILKDILSDLNENINFKDEGLKFNLKQNVLDEIYTIDDKDLLRYLIHRYRYEIYPKKKILDDYPPYLQIEPSSFCNYRCVFCFMTDNSFNQKKDGYMGRMKLDLFKKIIDDAEGNVEFVSLASRGEPLAAPDISEMLEYTNGKFLNLKINTNASLLDEKKCHAILSGGIKTLVISADAADEKLYSKLRVNGSLSKILKNIELFNKIKDSQYPGSKIITRVSGVKVSEAQSFSDMEKLWGGLVDQVAFVDYNPWENSYEKDSNEIIEPCSDLWRRMFVWWDGISNPCDVDYKSKLSAGKFPEKNLKELWKSEIYTKIRTSHLQNDRQSLKPCNACEVI